MHGGASQHNGDALTAQDADADEIADRSLDGIGGGEVLALVDLAGQLADRELGWVLCQHKIENGALSAGIVAFIGR